jgi:hypothetical protein
VTPSHCTRWAANPLGTMHAACTLSYSAGPCGKNISLLLFVLYLHIAVLAELIFESELLLATKILEWSPVAFQWA